MPRDCSEAAAARLLCLHKVNIAHTEQQRLLQVQIGCEDEENSHESSSAIMLEICSDKLRMRTRYRSPA